MIKDEVVEQDLRFAPQNVKLEVPVASGGTNRNCFDLMEEDGGELVVAEMETIGEKDLWLDREEQENLLVDVNDASIFYADFPPLPDFPCMSSSSSSSSTPAPSTAVIPAMSTSSSAATSASWAVMKSDEEDMNLLCATAPDETAAAALSSTASMEIPPLSDLGDVDCIDVNFGYMDLIDSNEIWNPSTVFQTENPDQDDQFHNQPVPGPEGHKIDGEDESDGLSFLQGNGELAVIFLEWLKQNREYISAEDMRSIKLKRSTIESASKRLGSTKEGKKQLLKLILEWVGQYQLQKKRLREGSSPPHAAAPYTPYHETPPNPEPDPCSNPNFSHSLVGFPHTPCYSSASPWMATAGFPMAAYSVGGHSNPVSGTPISHQVVNGIPYQADYPVMEHAQSWAQFPIPPSQFCPNFPDNNNMMGHQQAVFGSPYPAGDRLMRLGSSATKEARKKRMARQRRLYTHPHRHNSGSSQHMSNQMNDLHEILNDVGEDGDPATWLCCPHGDQSSPPHELSQLHSGDRATAVQSQRQPASDRRQQPGWKTEKNLKFLLQKVLKQSDVGSLGRIVLPKKEAESHLPELESRDGISIAMEDIGTSRVWNMRYRYWPNNKSRMYLLENTGDFVKANGLQEGDFIVIYSDTKCGKYMIRGIKVRQPGTKPESKKPVRRNNNNVLALAHASNASSFAPAKQAVR